MILVGFSAQFLASPTLCAQTHLHKQVAMETLRSELLEIREKQKAVQNLQRLKQKQIALLMQTLADVQATFHEVIVCDSIQYLRQRV